MGASEDAAARAAGFVERPLVIVLADLAGFTRR